MKIETNATEINEVREICETAKMQSEIVDIICESEGSFLEIAERLQNDEDMEDYVNNDGIIEIWGTRHFGANEQEYRIHVCTEQAHSKKLGI